MTQTENYFNRVAVSNSSIKDWKVLSPRQWKKKWIDKVQEQEPEQVHFTFGSLVDTILFTPDLLNDRFYVADFNLPSKTVESIIRNTYRAILVQNASIAILNTEPIPVQYDMRPQSLEGNEDLIILCANQVETTENGETKIGWQKNWKDETRVKKLIEEGKGLFEVLAIAGQRQIISSAMNMQAAELAEILKNDENTKDYFITKEGEELLFQLELYENFEGTVPIKGALDIVRIDHKMETIQIIDFKTNKSAFNFRPIIKEYGYDSQLSFYNYLIKIWKERNQKIKNYIVIDPINIVIDTKEKIPYIYEYNERDLKVAEIGNSDYIRVKDEEDFPIHPLNIRQRIGWRYIIQEIGWHWTNNKWDKPKEMYENGKIKLNLLNS